MADNFSTKMAHLLTSETKIDLRKAALRVAGAIGQSSDKTLLSALLAALDDPDEEARILAIEALGQLKVESALPRLEALVRQGGAELATSVHAAGQLGVRGAKAMGKIMDEASPSLRSRIAAELARAGTNNALVVTGHALLDDDPKVVDAAARSLAMEVPSFSTPQRHVLAKFLHDELHAKGKRHKPKTEAALVRVLGTLHEAKAEDVFWSRISAPHPAEVRAAALQALGNQGIPISAAKLPKLLACAADHDFQIVAAALMLLKSFPIKASNARPWLALLDAPDVATRRFAVDKLKGIDSAEVARGLAHQLGHPAKELREESLEAMLGFAAGRQALFDQLLESKSVEEAWFLARALAAIAGDFSQLNPSKLFTHAASLHDADDRRATPAWFLLRAADHDGARDQIEARADSLRKKKKFAEALSYYRLLTQDPACGEEVKFEWAATGLKLSTHDTAKEARAADPSLGQFARLLQNPAFDLIGKIAKAKWLAGDDLFYLGFHFLEQTHRAREFGKQVMELLVKRSPKTALGKQAKSKLKSEGFR